jgi:hypothetical protein
VLLALPAGADHRRDLHPQRLLRGAGDPCPRAPAVAAPRYLLINAGNANAGTGERGLADARACCVALAAWPAVRPEQVLPFSTGVIGEYLPVDRITAHCRMR